ncbi:MULTISPECIES: HK97 family phage prohead protease [Rhodopseudomonas]|uniref:HK97 family phage prohead protease n=1 Tax=Rhodopseudomonas TaxID=1073 RepID=UPI00069676BD|nr:MULTISPECIES: HK97 family phage prohead protease [Rhodopseudomonas]MDF3810084.1 HK97 family phage prohead protease [Rhodopseudomonas sp. BAL398]WOK18761.1 HK97 family phage prohead protease [Rhodopseudomonas sp. BAL398]
MDEFATVIGELELRAARKGRRRLRGRFPYRKRAVMSDGGRKGGRPQKEEFAPGAFSHSINNDEQDQHLLVGHSFDTPLASKKTGTLIFDDNDEALTFDAEITPQIADTSYGADILKQIDSGLSVGISPGFRIPPPRAVAKPEVFTDEGHDPARGMHNALIRTIFQAILFELSVVTRPAYGEASIAIDPEDMTDEEKLAAGWTMNAAGILVPPPLTITRAMPAALRWR